MTENLTYHTPDYMIKELEGYTGRLVAPEAIHELDLRAIYETIVEEMSKAVDDAIEAELQAEDLRDDEMNVLENHLRVALEVLEEVVEADRIKKGRDALLAFQKASHTARRVLSESWA